MPMGGGGGGGCRGVSLSHLPTSISKKTTVYTHVGVASECYVILLMALC